MGNTVPAITISILADPVIKIRFANLQGHILEVTTPLSAWEVSVFRKSIYEDLEQVKNFWTKTALRTDINFSIDGLCRLIDIGKKYCFKLFGPEYNKVKEFFISSIPNWKRSSEKDHIPSYIEITSPFSVLLPLELLPLFGTNYPKKDTLQTDNMLNAAAQFPAFSTITRRILSDVKQLSNTLLNQTIDNSNNLQVRFFQHDEHQGVKIEQDFLRSIARVNLRGPWPDSDLKQGTFEDQFTRLVYEASDNANGAIDHIQHFCCHFDTKANNTDDHFLLLGHRRHRVMLGDYVVTKKITLGTIQSKFINFTRNNENIYPLVFLNACGSAKVNLNGATSFPGILLRIYNRGVIGTEAQIPEILAARFSENFYALMIQRKTLGEAIFRSRWEVAIKYNNYLGILYSVYANPDLRFAIPMNMTPKS
jgi:hypothetical protein